MTNTSCILTPCELNQTNSSSILSLDELLDILSFSLWQTQINTFLLPPINLIGLIFSSYSLWIFTRSIFVEPIFFYYKLFSFVNVTHLLHNIPYCILLLPRYFPSLNTYAISVYSLYYIFASTFFYHFEDVIQMGILLHKMKAFSPFVKKHFRSRLNSFRFVFLSRVFL